MAWQKRNARRRSTLREKRSRRGAWFEAFEDRVLLASFFVTDPGDSGPNTLRQAILDANAATGAADIQFAASLGTIALNTPLPAITHPVVVNSTSQTGVVVDGKGSTDNGFILGAGSGGSTIQGLTIQNFTRAGIDVLSSGNKIFGNTIGAVAAPNGTGVLVEGGGSSNTIGDADPGKPNTIGYNTAAGVSIQSGSLNVVSWNHYVGANGPGSPASTSDINVSASANFGLTPPVVTAAVNDGGSLKLRFSNTLPGGTVVQVYQSITTGQPERTILGFAMIPTGGADAVTLSSPPALGSTVLVTASVAADGTSAFSNESSVVDPYTVTNTAPAGLGSLFQVITNANSAAPGMVPIKFAIPGGSVIHVPSGSALPTITHQVVVNANNQAGIVIDGGGASADGFVLGAGSGGSTIQGLTIQNFAGAGVHVLSSGNQVQGNTIGATGAGNGIGVLITGGSSNTIGGAGAAANTIGYSTAAGVNIQSGAMNVATQNLFVGTNGPGVPASASDVVLLPGANNNQQPLRLVNGSVDGSGQATLQYQINVPGGPLSITIELYKLDGSGNRVFVDSRTVLSKADGSTESVTLGHGLAQGDQLLATATVAANGTSAFSNVVTTADLYTVTNNSALPSAVGSLAWVLNNVNLATPGGPAIPVKFNIASGSTVINVAANPLPTVTHAVFVNANNQAGIVIDGGGSAGDGFVLGAGSGGSTIQGLTIRSFAGAGIHLSSSGNQVQGNILGAAGAPNGTGVLIDLGGSSNTIGGAGAAANTIGYNTTAGVSIQSGSKNVVTQNLYVGAGNPSNPPIASDIVLLPGANNNQQPLHLVNGSVDGSGQATLRYQINVPGGPLSITIELYKLDGFGNRVFVDTQTVLSKADGSTESVTLGHGLAQGDQLLATATVAANGTSAFSNVVTTADLYTVTNNSALPSTVGSLAWVLNNVNLAASGNPAIPVKFNIASGSTVINVAAYPLPTIIRAAVINVNNQSGIVIDGGGSVVDGLILGAGSDGSTIQGLTIRNFVGAGIHIFSANDKVEGNTIGATGAGNGIGVLITGGSSNTIGGAGAAANTIGYNAAAGVSIQSGSKNVVTQNLYVGAGNPSNPPIASDILLLPGANNNQQPLYLVNASIGDSGQATLQYQINVPHAVGSSVLIAIELYKLDGSGNRVFVDTQTVTSKADGSVEFVTLGHGLAPGDQLLATATVTENGTSAFSNVVTTADLYTVTNTNDYDPNNPSQPREGTLRFALANATRDGKQITFHISVGLSDGGEGKSWTINLLSTIFVSGNPSNHESGIVVDGLTQPGSNGFPVIQIAKYGLEFDNASFAAGKGIVVRGLSFINYAGAAPDPTNPPSYNAALVFNNVQGAQVVGNYIGIGAGLSSGAPMANTIGVLIKGGSSSIDIGQPGGANTIGFNTYGVRIQDVATHSNVVSGNYIGTDGTGQKADWQNGTGVYIDNSPNNVVGGAVGLDQATSRFQSLGQGNIIGANSDAGVDIEGAGATGNLVLGNYIGVSPANPTRVKPGNAVGVRIVGAGGNTVGSGVLDENGHDASANVIGNNSADGVFINNSPTPPNVVQWNYLGTDRDSNALGNLNGVHVVGGNGNQVLDNTIGFNRFYGVYLDGSDSNLVQRNFVGTSRGGVAIGNQKSGVYLLESSGNLLGSWAASASAADGSGRNVVWANATNGIEIVDSTNNFVTGNDVSWNLQSGVVVQNGSGNQIGGPMVSQTIVASVGNTIMGNGVDGVLIQGLGTAPNLVQGNQIARNIQNGVHVVGDLSAGSTLAWIADNFIGTDATGTTAFDGLGRTYGNGLSGVLLEQSTDRSNPPAAPSSTFGVYVTGNTLSGNGLSGLTARQAQGGASPLANAFLRASVTSNMIGLDKTGAVWNSGGASGNSPLGNVLDGVRIDNVVGLVVGSNVISGNLGRGVEILGGSLTSSTSTAPPEGWDDLIVGNKIGTNAAGTIGVVQGGSGFGNLADGVFLLSPAATRIENNLIGGNRGAGVHASSGADGKWYGKVTATGNWIGVSMSPDGSNIDLNNGADGVFLDSIQNVAVQGNRISNNRANGIDVLNSAGIEIVGNTIGLAKPAGGTGSDSANNVGNFGNGVFLNGSVGVTIGGATSGRGNLISGNQASGILISQGRGNLVQGNKIGVGADGLQAVPNLNSGVIISLSSGNRIGGAPGVDGPTPGNQISGNQLYGVLVVGNKDAPGVTTGNTIVGNLIGASSNDSSSLLLGNSSDGVFLLNAPNNWIGGPDESLGNVISGNKGQGVRIFGSASTGNEVANNRIGVDWTGSAAVANGGNGVLLDNAGANHIGPGNVLSGNKQSGLMVVNTIQGAAGSIIEGNLIGLAASGSTSIANNADGILVFGSSGNWMVNNTISGNALDGVQIFSPGLASQADSNVVVGNRIGTDWSGTAALGNQGDGVHIINGSGNTVGGVLDGARNVISGNRYNGVDVEQQSGPGLTARSNWIIGNFIGTDASGYHLLEAPSGIGRQQFGVLVNNATGNYIGVAPAGAGAFASTSAPQRPSNVISGNSAAGVALTGAASSNQVQGNFIGVAADGTAYVADRYGRGLFNPIGVLINANAVGNLIGGSAPGTGNIITQSSDNLNDQSTPPNALTTYVGVEVASPTATGNRIEGNMIGLDSRGQVGFNTVGVLLENSIGTVVGGYIDPQATARPNVTNLISGNSLAGIEITGQLAQRNQIYNNYIGTDATGAGRPGLQDPQRAPAQASGVLILQGTLNIVGAGSWGAAGGNGNVISGNGVGVNISSQSGANVKTSTNWIQGNLIGTDPAGKKANPNFEFGVFITASASNKIQNNLISANGLAGVEIFGGASQLASNAQGTAADLGTELTGNSIGLGGIDVGANHPTITLPDGIQVSYGLQQHGVVIIGASNNQVGLPGNGNQITGNIQTGVYISRRDNNKTLYALPINNVVQDNNLSSNGLYGVFRYDAPAGNPVVESPSSDANVFTGTPIPIGDYVTGFNLNVPITQPRSSAPGGRTRPASARVFGPARRVQTSPAARPVAMIRRVAPGASAVRLR